MLKYARFYLKDRCSNKSTLDVLVDQSVITYRHMSSQGIPLGLTYIVEDEGIFPAFMRKSALMDIHSILENHSYVDIIGMDFNPEIEDIFDTPDTEE